MLVTWPQVWSPHNRANTGPEPAKYEWHTMYVSSKCRDISRVVPWPLILDEWCHRGYKTCYGIMQSQWSLLSFTISTVTAGDLHVAPCLAKSSASDGQVRVFYALQTRHNERDGVSNHHRIDCLLNCWFRRRNQSSMSLAFVRGIHRWPPRGFPSQRAVTRKMFPWSELGRVKCWKYISNVF